MLALDQHIKAKQEFVEGYKQKFRHGGKISRTEILAKEFLENYGISISTLHRWAKLLDDAFAWKRGIRGH